MLSSDTAQEEPEADETPTESVRLGALSLPARIVIAVAVGGVAAFTAWHLAMVFLFVTPSNTLNEEYDDTVRGYIYPEFEQNWKLFAPNPLQRNESLSVRAEVTGEDGAGRVTDWISLTDIDVEGIEHQLLPSHTAQNTLRRAWDFYTKSHDEDGEPVGARGELSESYVRRIALLRLQDRIDLGTVERIQLRSTIQRVPAPEWRQEDFDTDPVHEELDWWPVTTEDLPSGQLATEWTGEASDLSEGEQR